MRNTRMLSWHQSIPLSRETVISISIFRLIQAVVSLEKFQHVAESSAGWSNKNLMKLALTITIHIWHHQHSNENLIPVGDLYYNNILTIFFIFSNHTRHCTLLLYWHTSVQHTAKFRETCFTLKSQETN